MWFESTSFTSAEMVQIESHTEEEMLFGGLNSGPPICPSGIES